MSRDERVAARTSIRDALASARAAVRKLDVIVANHPSIGASVREVWKRDRRVDYTVRSRKTAPPPDTATVPAVAVPKPLSAVAPAKAETAEVPSSAPELPIAAV
jgi:hypothetical protein